MGTCYKILLMDEFDWGYVDTSKEKKLLEFKSEYGEPCELIAEWYGCAVFDVDKRYPLSDERKQIINKFCDKAYYIDDLSLITIKDLES